MTGGVNARERISHLYDYLSALAREVYAKPVRHVGDYDVAVTPADVEPHLSVRLGPSAGEAWLRVAKTPKPTPPTLPRTLTPFLHDTVIDDPNTPPQLPPDLPTRVGAPADELDRLRRVEAAFAAWVADVWEPWALQARPAIVARRLYETLFRLRQRMRTDEATHELVWGHGILGWRVGGHRVCHPMLVSQVRIVFDDESGDLSTVRTCPT